jgi:hypothetical protein
VKENEAFQLDFDVAVVVTIAFVSYLLKCIFSPLSCALFHSSPIGPFFHSRARVILFPCPLPLDGPGNI